MGRIEPNMDQAKQRMTTARDGGYAITACYDRRKSRIIIELSTGIQLAFPVELVEGLSGASSQKLNKIEISPAGLGLHWPELDADVYVPALLQSTFGSKNWMAKHLGAKGGQARSEAKSSASRKNGRGGGRPRKPNAA